MNKILTKTFIKHYNTCFYVVKELIDGFEFFENDIFYQIFNIKLNKHNMKKIRIFFSRNFQKYFRNISKKIITK
jgi:hypothetical protein